MSCFTLLASTIIVDVSSSAGLSIQWMRVFVQSELGLVSLVFLVLCAVWAHWPCGRERACS